MKPSFMLKLLPPIWFFLFLGLALLAHHQVPATQVFHLTERYYEIAGIVVFIIGMILSLQASKVFKENDNEILPTSPSNRILITAGPYMISRNPMYLGMILALLGIALSIGTLPVFIAALAQFIVLNTFFIPFEEEKLTRIFGNDYLEYKKSVRRWF